MTNIVCPDCNTQAYDDTSFFCYKCGAQLPVHIQKNNAHDLNFEKGVLKKESGNVQDDTLHSRKPGVINRIKPIEICARCGAPIIDENRIFCTRCTVYLRDFQPCEEFPVIQHSGSKSLDKNHVTTQEIYQDTETRTTKEQESTLIQTTENPINPKVSGRKIIIIVVAIAILFFVLIMMILLMFTFWTSLY